MATTKKRSVDEVRFEIDQLRKDKIIYAIESCAISLIAIFGYFITNMYGGYLAMRLGEQKTVNTILGINTAFGVLAIGYAIYMGISNSKRLKKIKNLEAEL